MTNCVGFPFVSHNDARVLILGTLPGVESLKQRQYYAKKQNSFWKIMGELMGACFELPYENRLKRLMDNDFALWDVCAAAKREGSLDSNIEYPMPNDFASFFEAHQNIELICFNGQNAEKLFRRYVEPNMAIPHKVLPSTSPAYAGMVFVEKLARWREALGPFIAGKKSP